MLEDDVKRNRQKILNNNKKIYIRNIREKKESEILLYVQTYTTENGLNLQEIADLMKMDRHSIEPYLKNLIEKNLIQKNDNGKYLSTLPMNKDPIFRTRTFGLFFQRILDDIQPKIVNSDSIRMNINYLDNPKALELLQSFTYSENIYKKYLQNTEIEKFLIEYSNRIGAYIIYLCIYSLNIDNYPEKNLSLKQKMARKMVEKGIHQIAKYILPIFVKKIYFNNFSTMKYGADKYLLDEITINRLLLGFYMIYPTLTHEFEKILDSRPFFKKYLADEASRIDFYKNELDTELKIRENQKNCSHDFDSPILIDKLKITVLKCKKCRFEKIEKQKKEFPK